MITTPASPFQVSGTAKAAEKGPRNAPHHASARDFVAGVEVTEVDGPMPSEFAQLFAPAEDGPTVA
jgi:hypothetical protein